MSIATLFAQIRKVDEEKRLVFGRIAEEQVDKADEIMDYMSSKPHFQKWSADIAADTGGKNLGNVRAMHGKVAAGALTQIDYDDVGKTVDVAAHIVDDNEWKKVLAGVYTGFSIGGKYIGEATVEKSDGRDVKRYTAAPSEVSLVDRPCMKGAKFFEVQKSDGSLAKVDFVPELAEDLEVNGTAEDLAALGKFLNDNKLSIADINKALPAWLADKAKGKKGADDKKDDDAKEPTDDEKAAAAAAAAAAAEKLAKVTAARTLLKVDAADKRTDDELIAAADAQIAKVADARAKLMKGVSDPEHLKGKSDDEILKLADALDKVAPVADLAKMVSDAMAPLQKVIDEQAARLAKLEAQPAPATVRLRAVSKAADMSGEDDSADRALAEKFAPVTDASGGKHEVAGLIKGLHAIGGRPMAMPPSIR